MILNLNLNEIDDVFSETFRKKTVGFQYLKVNV